MRITSHRTRNGGNLTQSRTCRLLVSPKTRRCSSRSRGGDSNLSVLADSDEIGGLLSHSDSLEYVLLGLLCSEPLTREARLSNVARW